MLKLPRDLSFVSSALGLLNFSPAAIGRRQLRRLGVVIEHRLRGSGLGRLRRLGRIRLGRKLGRKAHEVVDHPPHRHFGRRRRELHRPGTQSSRQAGQARREVAHILVRLPLANFAPRLDKPHPVWVTLAPSKLTPLEAEAAAAKRINPKELSCQYPSNCVLAATNKLPI